MKACSRRPLLTLFSTVPVVPTSNQGKNKYQNFQGRPQDYSQRGARFFRNKTFSGIRNKSKEKGSKEKMKKKGTQLKKKEQNSRKKVLSSKSSRLRGRQSPPCPLPLWPPLVTYYKSRYLCCNIYDYGVGIAGYSAMASFQPWLKGNQKKITCCRKKRVMHFSD